MGQNPYPVEIADSGGGPVKTAGDLTFTDPGNQPGGSIPDPVTTPIHIQPSTTDTPLTVTGATGSAEDNSTLLEVLSDVDTVMSISARGGVFLEEGDGGQALEIDLNAFGQGVVVYNSSFSALFKITNTGLGFFGAAAAQPVVPLTTPTVQDVIDALVALGLVAQHD
jgi:hypothetical protein